MRYAFLSANTPHCSPPYAPTRSSDTLQLSLNSPFQPKSQVQDHPGVGPEASLQEVRTSTFLPLRAHPASPPPTRTVIPRCAHAVAVLLSSFGARNPYNPVSGHRIDPSFPAVYLLSSPSLHPHVYLPHSPSSSISMPTHPTTDHPCPWLPPAVPVSLSPRRPRSRRS